VSAAAAAAAAAVAVAVAVAAAVAVAVAAADVVAVAHELDAYARWSLGFAGSGIVQEQLAVICVRLGTRAVQLACGGCPAYSVEAHCEA